MTVSSDPVDGAEHPNRRSFLNKVWIGLGFVALTEFAAMAAAFLRPQRPAARKGGFGGIIVAGPVTDFARGSVTAFKNGRFYLARLEDGGFLALSRTCTHLGCTLPWDDKQRQFICPCHASAFDIRGDVLRPPAPHALDIYPVLIERDMVSVDTGRWIKRSQFRADQVAYPPQRGAAGR